MGSSCFPHPTNWVGYCCFPQKCSVLQQLPIRSEQLNGVGLVCNELIIFSFLLSAAAEEIEPQQGEWVNESGNCVGKSFTYSCLSPQLHTTPQPSSFYCSSACHVSVPRINRPPHHILFPPSSYYSYRKRSMAMKFATRTQQMVRWMELQYYNNNNRYQARSGSAVQRVQNDTAGEKDVPLRIKRPVKDFIPSGGPGDNYLSTGGHLNWFPLFAGMCEAANSSWCFYSISQSLNWCWWWWWATDCCFLLFSGRPATGWEWSGHSI